MNCRILTLLACILFVGGCSAPVDAPPAPAETELCPILLGKLQQDIEADAFPNLQAVVVLHHGELAFEAQIPGVDPDETRYSASVSKSIGSMLLGIAIEGRPGILNEPIRELLPELAAGALESIRLRHVLSMTPGLAWDENSHPYDDPRNDWVRVRDRDDVIQQVFSQPLVEEPGTRFVYNGGMSAVVGALLEKLTEGHPQRFANERLFEPLGIRDHDWRDLHSGVIDIAGGLTIRPRDLARLGQLMLQGGEWEGEQIVPRAWVSESTRRHIENSDQPDYGLHWWMGDYHYQAQHAFAYMASGHGGQRLVVVPERDLVVVIMQEVFGNPLAEPNALAILTRYVMPAADDVFEPPVDQELSAEELAAYAGEYRMSRGPFSIEVREDALWAIADNAPPLQLASVAPDRFRGLALDRIEIEFVFERNDSGEVFGGRSTWAFQDDVFARVETSVSVLNADFLEVARLLADEGSRVAVLNMANRQVPGGGVLHGSGAQEENLFRRSSLAHSLYQFSQVGLVHRIPQHRERISYPIPRESGGIYSPDVMIFRSSESSGYAYLPEPFDVGVITVPAINSPETDMVGGEERLVPRLAEATRRKIRGILRIGANHRHEDLVLSAFGCGAFRNPPGHMAELFAATLAEEEFAGVFRRVVFAILDDHNARGEWNYLPFLRANSRSNC